MRSDELRRYERGFIDALTIEVSSGICYFDVKGGRWDAVPHAPRRYALNRWGEAFSRSRTGGWNVAPQRLSFILKLKAFPEFIPDFEFAR